MASVWNPWVGYQEVGVVRMYRCCCKEVYSFFYIAFLSAYFYILIMILIYPYSTCILALFLQ